MDQRKSYTSWFPMFDLPNLDLLMTLQQNYNDWMHAQQVASKGRLAWRPCQYRTLNKPEQSLLGSSKWVSRELLFRQMRLGAGSIAMRPMNLCGP